jgi:predicted hotdog family 3-hydroxylacyl-ACP dehydratase
MKYSLPELLPHREPMILLSGYRENGDCFVRITKDDLFFDESIDGVPIVVGVEYMAQAIALAATLELKRGDPYYEAQIGFLLGTRSYKSYIEFFQLGRTYEISAKSLFVDAELASFECAIADCDGKKCAEAILNVFRPKDRSRLK